MTVFFDQDELWEGAEASEIHERIRHHLSKHKFGSATSLLAAAKDKFPIFKKLEEAEKVEGGGNDGEEDEISLEEQFRQIFFMPLVPEIEAGIEETQNPGLSDFVKQQMVVNFLQEAVEFASIFDEALPVVCQLLGSKQVLILISYQIEVEQ